MDSHEVADACAFVEVLELGQLSDLCHLDESGQLEQTQKLIETADVLRDQTERNRAQRVENEESFQITLSDDPAVRDQTR